ncbi:response regulator transcription factor [Myxococcus sp. RHSTA-1-4]|uniref:response regulator transcription factor n=1 Tax=Myxococcus sp. RHSTA-1-4 TaxID=2874601 RepID=UPI001CBD9AF2|nr:response regulator transcription factor [Myxococcus sp. RHSTA-1-4]MBZ4422366.1 response regulator transcription factor [Myxococcus sp. RHSTA-1-4]
MDNVGDSPLQVLLAEDDEKLARLTARYLERRGIALRVVRSGTQALLEAVQRPFDAVLLDVMLPGRNGLAVCQELRRRSHVPIIMVTARDEEADRVLGLELGADDYLSKPFSSRGLLARIHAQVRRARGRAGPELGTLRVGGLALDTRSFQATLDGRPLGITPHEFALLRVLAERTGQVLTRERLLELARGSAEEVFDRAVDVHIFRIRQKLEQDPRRPRLLKTVRGAGYMLVAGSEP